MADPAAAPRRSYAEEMAFITKLDDVRYEIAPGFVPDMRVPGKFFVNSELKELMFDEVAQYSEARGVGGFLPAMKQIANVAQLPGIVGCSLAMPDVHSGYGFPIGGVAAFDCDDPESVVSPGGVGFDINCGVRLLRTNLREEDVRPMQEELAQSLFDHIPVGVGAKGTIPMTERELLEVMEMGIDWSLARGFAWAEDKEHTEDNGRILNADPTKVSKRARKRGLPQIGTLGGGNHYIEVQVVREIFDEGAAEKMGLYVGQVVVMLHSGSRGLGHQIATDALIEMEKAMVRDGIRINDRQLACARIASPEGQDYLAALACAANFAYVSRQAMTFLCRQAFAKAFKTTPEALDMHLIYDVSHNIAKQELHAVVPPGGGEPVLKRLLVHRKGATRAFPPHHPSIPADYQFCGQPIIIGGSMGTESYVLAGTDRAMAETFGSTCHGAGRAQSRNKARRTLAPDEVLADLQAKGISIRVASPKLVTEECDSSYKNVREVAKTCEAAGISRRVARMVPICVIKG